MSFTERAPIEAGFSDVFAERVAPALDRLEAERQSQLATARKHAAVPIGVAVVLALLLLLVADDLGGIARQPGHPRRPGGPVRHADLETPEQTSGAARWPRR